MAATWASLRKLVKECQKDDIFGLSAEMAYWIIFSLFPFFIFLGTLAGIVGQIIGTQDLLDSVTDNLYRSLDPATADMLRDLLGQVVSPTGGALSVGAAISALFALNSASAAIGTMMKAFNRAYGVTDKRHFVVQKLTAIALTLTMIILLIGGTLLLSLGGRLLDFLDLGGFARFVLTLLRIIGALAGITLGFAIVYWKGPAVHQPFRWFSRGVLISTIGLGVFSYLFGLYVQLFAGASFNKTYGTIAGVVLFLFFLRLASLIILVGAEINAEALRDRGVLTTATAQDAEVAALDPGRVLPDVAERLRVLRERPVASLAAGVRARREGRPAAMRAEESRRTVGAVGVATITALGGVAAAIMRSLGRR